MNVVADPRAHPLGASFRDPGGFVFEHDGRILRQVNRVFAEEFDAFLASGLWARLVAEGLLIPHEEVAHDSVVSPAPALAHRIVAPERVAFISYPYEWSFSQLRDAALVTLEIQKRAIDAGFTLRDASAYNIQLHRGRPVLIDTLSFERMRAGEPWVAYRQFCQHFLAPLLLMAYADVRLSALLRHFIDGVPVDLASRLLPARTRFLPAVAMHIHLHARAQRRFAGKSASRPRRVSTFALKGLVDNLESVVRRLSWKPEGTEWGDYYDATNYTDEAMREKARLVSTLIEHARPAQVWDLGANTGVFSRLASDRGIPTVAFDIDPAAVEKNYRYMRSHDETSILPLVMDLTNPSPALGWDHDERASLAQRGPADLVLALALIHHLAISNNVPLGRVARFLAGVGRELVIEFVPKSDSQVQRLLATRADIFPDYHRAGFEAAFGACFETVESVSVAGSERTLYRMRRRPGFVPATYP